MIMGDVYSIEDILGSLPRYQADNLKYLLDNNSEDKTVELWLNSQGPSQTTAFGGDINRQGNKTYYQCFKHQMNRLICGHPEYKAEYNKFIGEGRSMSIATASAIGAWLAPIIGLLAIVVIPAVELFLHTTFKVGRNAYCEHVNFEE